MSIHSRQKRKQWGCNPTSDCQKMTSIHAAAFSEYSVKPTTHTRPCHPQRQSGCIAKRCSSWTCWSAVPRSRPGGSDISRSASCSRALWSKQNVISLTCQSLWFKTWQTIQKSTVAYSLYIFDNSPRSEMNDETTAPPKRQNFFLSKNVEDMTWIHAAAFNGDNRTPGLGTLGTNVVVFPVDVHDGLVDLQCLGQGLEAATDQGWRLDFKRPTDKTLDLKSSDQRTFNLTKTCKSLWLNPCKNNPEINSSLQHLHIWQLSLRWKMNDGAHHTPGLGALVANPVPSHIDVLDGRVCLQRLGQGLETETDQGWRLHPGLYRSNRDHWNPENTWHLTLTCESLWYRT